MLAQTLWFVDFQAAPGGSGELGGGSMGQKYGRDRVREYQLYDVFASTHDGPKLIFTPRGDNHK